MHTRGPLSNWKMFYLPGRVRIEVPGLLHSPQTARHLKAYLGRLSGLQRIEANHRTGRVLIIYDLRKVRFTDVEKMLQAALQDSRRMPPGLEFKPPQSPVQEIARKQAANLALTTLALAFLALKHLIRGKGPGARSMTLLSISSLLTFMAGYPLLRKGLDRMTRKGEAFNYSLLLGIIGFALAILRESIPGLSVMWFNYLSDLLQTLNLSKTQREIERIIGEFPVRVHAIKNGEEREVPLGEFVPGMIVSLHQGDVVPVDGVILEGEARINEGVLSGNPELVARKKGDNIHAGSIVEEGHLLVKARWVGSGPAIAGLNRCRYPLEHRLEWMMNKKGGKLADTALTLAAWNLVTGGSWDKSLAMLLMGCPGNLHLARAVPLGRALRLSAKNGVLVKSPQLYEETANLDTLLFDKTGTLTHMSLQDMEIVSLSPLYTREDLLALVAGVEKNLPHPIARMLVKKARQEQIPVRGLQGEAVTGQGVRGYYHGQQVLVGSTGFMKDQGVVLSEDGRLQVLRLSHLGYSALYIALGQELIGLIGLREVLNPGVRETVNRLRALGLKEIGLVSGDREESARIVGESLGLSLVRAPAAPEEKAELIQKLQSADRKVAMVGDGVNDSAALVQADVGLSIGPQHNPGAVAAAGVIVANSDLTNIPAYMQLSRRTQEIIEQNMTLSAGLNSLGLALAVMNKLSPFTASVLQNLGTIGLFLNTYRLRMGTQSREARRKAKREIMTAFRQTGATCLREEHGSWHNLSSQELLLRWRIDSSQGIDAKERRARLVRFGPNMLQQKKRTPWWKYLVKQLDDYLVKLLMAVAGISLVLGKGANAVTTLAILAVNAGVGIVQEIKAEKAIAGLDKMTQSTARIISRGKVEVIPVAQLVPGDVILLEAGDKIPADARLLESENLLVDEAILTGENNAVYKNPRELPGQKALGDRTNMVYAGTLILKGVGKALVVATGQRSEVGKIAAQLSRMGQQELPIQKRMEELGRSVVKACSITAAVIAGIGLLRGQPLLEMIMTALTLLVAAIPEGLTVMVLIAMALGIRRMAGKKVAVRQLPALETLGATTVICCDKTGTLTKNQLRTEVVYTPGKIWSMPVDNQQAWLRRYHQEEAQDLRRLLSLAVLCNSVQEDSRRIKVAGDPTDLAISAAGSNLDIYRYEIAAEFPVVKQVPFDPEEKQMSVLCLDDNLPLLVIKGAPEVILQKCRYQVQQGTVKEISAEEKEKLGKLAEHLATQSLRLIAVAYRYCQDNNGEEQELIFVGLLGMRDQIRPEAGAAVAKCHRAGVKVIMITGDHPTTARTIAREVGILRQGDLVLTGAQMDKMTDQQLAGVISRVSVFARTAPVQKLRIVKALQAANQVVAMTGDGVNDAPAIKAADIGIAMGKGGTDVAREAASLVLLDDNFTTIVGAMEEGRNIYFNIRKSARYLLATNAGEVVIMALAVLLGSPMPLNPAQLLWLNFIGDGLPAIALVSHEPGEGLLDKAPRSPQEDIFAHGLDKKIIRRGVLLGIGSYLAYLWGMRRGGLNKARTLAMSSLTISQFWHLLDAHSGLEKGVRQKPHNFYLGGAALASFSLFAASLYIPSFARLFQLVPINLLEWAFLVGVSGLVWLADAGDILTVGVKK